MQHVKVKSYDGTEFLLTTEIAYRSDKIKEVCRHQGLNKTVTLSLVSGYMLEKIVTWIEHYKDGLPLDRDSNRANFNEWDLEFLKIERETLFALTKAADNMEVRDLKNYCAQAIASLMYGKSSAQIRGIFGLPRLNSRAHQRGHGV